MILKDVNDQIPWPDSQPRDGCRVCSPCWRIASPQRSSSCPPNLPPRIVTMCNKVVCGSSLKDLAMWTNAAGVTGPTAYVGGCQDDGGRREGAELKRCFCMLIGHKPNCIWQTSGSVCGVWDFLAVHSTNNVLLLPLRQVIKYFK